LDLVMLYLVITGQSHQDNNVSSGKRDFSPG